MIFYSDSVVRFARDWCDRDSNNTTLASSESKTCGRLVISCATAIGTGRRPTSSPSRSPSVIASATFLLFQNKGEANETNDC